MKKIFAALATLTLTLVLAAGASAGRARAEQERYNYGDAAVTPAPHGYWRFRNFVDFDTLADERSIRVVIRDQTGLEVAAEIAQDTDGDGELEPLTRFCGATSRQISITGGIPVRVRLNEGMCSNGGTPVAVSGTVEATFTR